MANEMKVIGNAAAIIERFGGIRPMATKIAIPVTTIQGWKKRNVIPANRLDQIVKAASQHNIDISDILASAPIANENEVPIITQPAPPSFPGAKAPEAAKESEARTVPAHIYDDLIRKVEDMERKAVVKSALISAMLLLGTVAAFVFLFQPQAQFRQDDSQILALQEDVTQLEGRMANVQQKIPQNLGQRLSSLQQQAQTAGVSVMNEANRFSEEMFGPAAGNLEQRLAKLESHIADLTGSAILTGVMQHMMELQESAGGQELLSRAWVQLTEIVGSAAPGGDQRVQNALEQSKTQNPDVAQLFSTVPAGDLKAAALILGAAQVRSALGRDRTPFAQDLQIIKNLAADDPELTASIDRLLPKAEQGVLTPAGLGKELAGLTGEIAQASLRGEDLSLTDRALARVNNVLQVEKNGELISGTPTQSALATTQQLLVSGDIEGAIASAKSLQGPAASVIAPWINEADATLMAQRLKNNLTRVVSMKAYGQGITTMDAPLPGMQSNYYKH